MRNDATAQGFFGTLTIGLTASAALLALAACALSYGQFPHYPTNAPPPSTLLSPTTLARIIEVYTNGLRYRHWAAGAVAQWHTALTSRDASFSAFLRAPC